MTIHVLLILFGWPAGIVLGNLMANVFWLPIQWAGLHLKLAAHARALHDRLDSQDAALEELRGLLGVPGGSSDADLLSRDGNS
jgi:hypothetical protein